MTINYNGQQYTIPSSLHSITLKQWINWKESYGSNIEAQQKEIALMHDSSEKDVEAFLLLSDAACKFFSFYTGIEIEEVHSNFDVNQLIHVYASSSAVMDSEQEMLEVEDEYLFDNAIWKILPPYEIMQKEGLFYDSFQMVKKLIIDLKAFSDGDWKMLPSLCAFYFRKEGEAVSDIIKYLEERKALMRQLPLDIGLTVAKYLNVTMKAFVELVNADSPKTEIK